MLTKLSVLHDLTLIHTDLKPENILLKDASYQTFTYSRKVPSSQAGTTKPVSQRRVLLDPEIRLIDFGSATYQDEYHSSVVSTRHYRAPEIIMGLGWSYPCDIWSIGCILVEFYTGDALFQTHDNLEHLAMMEAVVDKRIDAHLIRQAKALNTPGAKLFKRGKLDYPNNDVTRASRRFVKGMKKLTVGPQFYLVQALVDITDMQTRTSSTARTTLSCNSSSIFCRRSLCTIRHNGSRPRRH